ncbi:SDR family oxidoreductase [soil metagenome]
MNRTAIVTGGSRGIGRAIVERLTTDGFDVVFAYAGNAAAADEVAQLTGAVGIQADVADETAIATLFAEAEQRFGGVDVVINSAGIMELGAVAGYDLDAFDRTMRTNVRGTFVVSQAAANAVRPGGAIINFSTTVVKTNLPNYGAYVMSKGAVEGLTLILAKELAGKDVTVNVVAPGPTATDLFLTGKSDELIAHLASLNPMNRLGQPVDIAEVVAFLAGPARWVNGQTIYVNGGAA